MELEEEAPVSEEKEPEPTLLGGLAPLIAAIVAMAAVWGSVTYMNMRKGVDPETISAPTLEAEDEGAFRRAYLVAALRASVGADEAERKAAEGELRRRRDLAGSRPGGTEALDAWIKEEIAKLAVAP